MMDNMGFEFLKGVVGPDGARALEKAAERAPSIAPALVPRAIVAWLTANEEGYEGALPGVDGSFFTLVKSEAGYSGVIAVGDALHAFEGESFVKVAAGLSVILEVDVKQDDSLRKNEMGNLGKSVDQLVFAQWPLQKMARLDPNAGYTFKVGHRKSGETDVTEVHAISPDDGPAGRAIFHHRPGKKLEAGLVEVLEEHRRKGVASAMYAHAEKATGKKCTPSKYQSMDGAMLWEGNEKDKQFGKQELPGQAAKPRGPEKPELPDSPRKQARIPTPKPMKGSSSGQPMIAKGEVKLNKSEMHNTTCNQCGQPQFGGEKFIGCLCLGPNAEARDYALVKSKDDQFTFSFGLSWSHDAISTLLNTVKR